MHANLTTEETYRQADIRQRETMKELVADLIQFCIARMGQEPPSGDEIFPFEEE